MKRHFPSTPTSTEPAPRRAKPVVVRRFAAQLLGSVLCAVFGLAPGAYADSTWTNPGTGSWADAANWLGGVPGSASSANLDNGGTARLETGVSGAAVQILIGTSIGGGASGSIEIAGGSLSTYSTHLGYFIGGTGYLSVTDGGYWNNRNSINVGYYGTGSLVVNGGKIDNVSAIIGNLGIGSGTATVTSGTWANTGSLTVGNFGTGTLLVNGGQVQNSNGTIGFAGSGSAKVTGGSWINSGTLVVGDSGAGTLVIDGGLVQNTDARLGNSAGSSGSASISSGTWRSTSRLIVGDSGSSTGTLNIDGGLVQNTSGDIAYDLYSRGSVSVTSGTWLNSSALSVGTSGTATLTISGGLVQCDLAWIGQGPSSKASATVGSGGSFINSSAFYVGLGGSGTLTVNGGLVRNTAGMIGYTSTGTGTVTVSSGTWVNTGGLTVGGSSKGSTLTIQNGGVVTNGDGATIGEGSSSFPASGSGNRVLVTGEGSTWRTANGLIIGKYGSNNLLTVRDGALVQIGNSADDLLSFSTQGSSANNFLRVDDGYVALFGDRVGTFENIIADGVIQLWTGSTWIASTDLEDYTITYFVTNEEAEAYTGYSNLGGYTILTASAIPEPSAIGLAGLGLASILLARRSARRAA